MIALARRRWRLAGLLVAALALGAAPAAAETSAPTAQQVASPAEEFGALFAAVQTARIFPDSKTFADATPRRRSADIVADFERQRPQSPDALRAFVLANFRVPGVDDVDRASLREHIRSLWPALVRQPDPTTAGGSLLALPAPYVVPGGRFREMYYWDSYFTMLGLKADRQERLVEDMLANFTYAVERYGHIPNGMRSYYLGRAQPPFFALMLDLSDDRDPVLAARRLAALRREYAYWMAGADCLDAAGACRRVVRMPDGAILNRYWDDVAAPRDESYAEDVATAREDGERPAAVLYRHLRAGAESGWDYSSRWLADPKRLSTIRTADIVPVDLNSLMLAMERTIARRCDEAGDARCRAEFQARAARRLRAIDRYLWRAGEGRYADWDRVAERPTPVLSAATLYPLFVGAASPAQRTAVARTVREQLLASGGLRTTLTATGQQWDAPNGWAPLQWIAIQGLDAAGDHALAVEIARRWLRTVDAAYRETGKLLEKYDVEELKAGGGGEYATQDGFGWTNGVVSALLARYHELSEAGR